MKIKLKDIFLFQDLDEESLAKIESFTSEEDLPKESIVFYEGDESKYLHLLLEGNIKLYKVTSSDKEVVLKFFGENELIGEVANFENLNYPATAESVTDIKILKINFHKLKEVIKSNPNFSYKIITSLIKKVKNLENLVSMQIVLDAKERVAKYLCENEEKFFITKNIIVAESLNISPETLSRTLRLFKNENLIDDKKKTIDKTGLRHYFM